MKRRAKTWLGCMVAAAVFFIAGAAYVSGRLPEGFGMDKFMKGVVAADV